MMATLKAAHLVTRLFVCLIVCIGRQDGAMARENIGEISESCQKGMSHYQAVAPYPYPLVYLSNEHGVTGQFLCDTSLQQGGWYIIQRRTDGSVSFDVGWDDYKHGIGSLTSDYWMGLESIHNLTSSAPMELYVYMEDIKGKSAYAHYSKFYVSNEADEFRLSLGGYDAASTAANAMDKNNDYGFTTKDRDNDNNMAGSCANIQHGGWWFWSCGQAFLNGKWREGFYHHSNEWYPTFAYDKNNYFSLVEMKVRFVDM